MVATGFLLGGFVAYQLWGTGIEARRAQTALEDEFEALLTSTIPTTPPSTTPASTGPGDTGPPPTGPADTGPGDTVADTLPDTVPTPVAQPVPPIVEGDPIARLEIPAIDVDAVVVAGVSVEDLRRGPGHYPDTPLPGQLGNAAIAGHRTTYGQWFHDVDQLEVGDEIAVTTVAGHFVYAVTGTEIVEPSDIQVVATTNPNIAELTLTSCHPKWSARQRIIIHSELVTDASSPVGAATIGYAAGSATATTSSVPSTTIESATATTSVSSTTSTAPASPTTTSIAPGTETTITTPSADAFADGWFHDRSAIPQVVFWGLVVAVIAVGASVVGRRFRSNLIGIAAGILPFLIALYFFYQNLNRLLPPSL